MASPVEVFYEYWESFGSCMPFAGADVCDHRDCSDRRACEKAHRAARRRARKDYNITVQRLVADVKEMDPRVQKHAKEVLQRAESARREAEVCDRYASKQRRKSTSRGARCFVEVNDAGEQYCAACNVTFGTPKTKGRKAEKSERRSSRHGRRRSRR